MLRDIDRYYLEQAEPAGSCLQALRAYTLKANPDLKEEWKYRMPGFSLRGKMFMYLWKDKKNGWPYILLMNGGLIDHPALEQGERKRMKRMLIDPDKKLPLKAIDKVLTLARAIHPT